MGFEVEVKFRADDPGALRERLGAIGAAPGAAVAHEDRYFAHPSRDFALTDEALRLRREGAGNAITYKGPKLGGPTKTREEIEVPFAPGPEALAQLATLLERLGFQAVATVPKTRTTFAARREGRALSVTIDDAGPLGTFAEVETLAADAADLPGAQAAVLALAADLGLRHVEPRSYLRMTLDGPVDR